MSEKKPFRLVWQEVAPGQWHAGGLGKFYVITEDEDGRLTLEQNHGDLGLIEIGEFPTLGRAMVAAHAHFRGDAAHANLLADPYLTRLKAAHPERVPA